MVFCSKCGDKGAFVQCYDEPNQTFCAECAKEHTDHRLRYVTPCHNCKTAGATVSCKTCFMRVCDTCQAKSHPLKRQIKKVDQETTKIHQVRRIYWPKIAEKPSYGSHPWMIKGTINGQRTTKTNTSDDNHLSRIKEKIAKMLRLAGNPGTSKEGEHAGKVASEWMSKYQLGKYDLAVKNELEGADYIVWVGNSIREREYNFSWISSLTCKIAKVFPNFVYYYQSTGKNYFGFLGVEDSCWSACEMLVDLMAIVTHHADLMFKTHHYKKDLSIQSYMLGMVDGLDVSSFADIPELLKGMNDMEREQMNVIVKAGSNVVERMRSLKTWNNTKEKEKRVRLDHSAYRKGQSDGSQLNGDSQKPLKLTY